MADLPDDTRPEPADLLAGLIADTRDRTERADVRGALDGIDEAMTANYRLTGDRLMGTKYEVWAWTSNPSAGYVYEQTWAGQSFIVALREARKAKRSGSGCVRIEWR